MLGSSNHVLVGLAQEAVEKLLQTSEALYGEPEQEIFDKEFFGFTYGNYAKLLTESFSQLRPKSHNSVHPMPGSPSKSASRRRLSAGNITGRAESQRRLSVPARVASALKLNVASITLSAQSLSFFSGESSKHKLGVQSRAPVSSKHPLPARRPSILKHASAARGPSSLRLIPGNSPRSAASGRSSWTSMHKNSVHPLPDQAPLPLTEPKQPSQLPSPNRDTLRSRASFSVAKSEKHSGMLSALPGSTDSQTARTGRILRSTSSVTASVFETARNLSSSDEEGSLAVPEDLIESALFLLRDRTLADLRAEVSIDCICV